MIRGILIRALTEARLVAYRCAAVSQLIARQPWRVVTPGDKAAEPPTYDITTHRLDAAQFREIAADAEALARAMLAAERGRP